MIYTCTAVWNCGLQEHMKVGTLILNDNVLNTYLAITEWGWVGYEEFCRSRRMLSSASVDNTLWDLQNSSYHTKAELCGSRKYPYPHHGGNWKFRRGGGVKEPGNSRGEGGCMIDLVSRGPLIQYGFQKSFLTYKVDFHMKNSGLNTCIWLALHLKCIFFLQKAV